MLEDTQCDDMVQGQYGYTQDDNMVGGQNEEDEEAMDGSEWQEEGTQGDPMLNVPTPGEFTVIRIHDHMLNVM